jgi:hypothetical protein
VERRKLFGFALGGKYSNQCQKGISRPDNGVIRKNLRNVGCLTYSKGSISSRNEDIRRIRQTMQKHICGISMSPICKPKIVL